MAQTTRMVGAMIEKGMRRMAANSGTSVSTSSTPSTFATYIEPMSPHTNSRCVWNSRAPGLSPQMKKPATRYLGPDDRDFVAVLARS